MYISRQDREALNALSTEIFGVSSKWQKMVKDGVPTVVTKEVTEEVPASEGVEATTRTITVPELDETGKKRSVLKFHSVEEMLTLMISIKEQRDAAIKEQAKKQLEAEMAKKAADLQAKINAEAMGSAI